MLSNPAMYRIGNQTLSANSPDLQGAIEACHGKSNSRPLCLCKRPGVEMYVAKVGDKYFLKRMPGTGSAHATDCESYEYPAELSGIGEVLGTAIQENVEDGLTSLKLGFSLSKVATGRVAPKASAGKESDVAKTDEKKLTLRSTLHYLWEEAGFHRWTPAMEGKRNWFVIRKFLLEAAKNKVTKGAPLNDVLFIPESFSVEHKDEILLRRNTQMNKLMGTGGGSRKLMMVIGELKEFAPARYGYKMVMKHLPDFPFLMYEDMYNRLTDRFHDELQMWDVLDGSHLLVIATFGLTPTGVATLEEASLFLTNENWIPVESSFEHILLSRLMSEKRSFTKGLRYNLPSYRPFASVVLTDADAEPVAVYIIPRQEDEQFEEAVSRLIDESEYVSIVWRPFEEGFPELPPQKITREEKGRAVDANEEAGDKPSP